MASSIIEVHAKASRYSAGFTATIVAALFTLIAAGAATPSSAVGIAADVLTEDDQNCLACHDSEGMEKDLVNGEILSLAVQGDGFAASVHSWVGCAGCHGDVDLESHPQDKRIDSRHGYAAAASEICADCHSAADLAEGPAHHARAAAAAGAACSECHNPHAVTAIAEWKAATTETAYCLTCHKQPLSMRLASGETLSLAIDEAVLRSSVHPDHECTDCHAGFAMDAHESIENASTREHVVARAGICGDCHADKVEQYEGSIHAILIGDGNLAAPVCSDCHGSHSVRPKAVYETVSGVPCKACHAEIFDAYAESMHGRVRGVLGHFEAPICADCHRAHEVDAVSGGRLREACLGCHGEATGAHEEWLPNAALHLEAVSCPACHAPEAQRRVELQLLDGAGRTGASEPIAGPQIAARIRTADADADGLNAVELWNLVRDLKREDPSAEVALQGRIAVQTGVDAHQLSNKTRAVRECASCHRQGADPFQRVTVSIIGHDGRSQHYNADKDVLNSVLSVNSVSGFYAIGGTRIKLLDILLALAFLGGISVPIGHVTVKWLYERYVKKPQEQGASRGS
ncbi:MAG: hypothetical protein JSU82_03360 [Rhodospirillales bacterium]|nr:MAG: hypothetical protein JSU82_03360 [Rhodospirillales bacterium]